MKQLFARGTVSMLVLMLFGISAISVRAQDASPMPGATGCTGEQASVDELLALWYPAGSGAATPAAMTEDVMPTEITIPIGSPADDATAAAVETTVREVFACFEAGDTLRAYALFTDRLATVFGPEPGTPMEDARAFLTAPPEPESPDEATTLVSVTDVMMLADGRVGAFVVEQGSDGTYLTSYAVFQSEGDRWLVDEVIEFSEPASEDEEE